MSNRWLLWVALGLASACATDTKASKADKPRAQPVSEVSTEAEAEETAEAEEAAEDAEESKPSAAPQNVVASVSNPAKIAPEQIPVEEDFVAAAQSRITRRNNLEAELNRIAAEIQAAHK